ncbi:MAG: hypothetical protein LC646_10750 [Xanthomonadaceae bacterium]|nr:hypothetical protein [Xanthomonadaceae bacterium]
MINRGWSLSLLLSLLLVSGCTTLRGTGDLGLVVERATGSVLVVDTTAQRQLARIPGLGDLSHASVVYSRDGRYGIGGAVSQDGRLIAVSNYEPGGVRVFDAVTLELLADIPAEYGTAGQRSKVVGLADAPGQRFVFSLFDAGEIWIADLSEPRDPQLRKYTGIGRQPYDALISPDGRHYLAGLFGEDGLAMLDLWHPDRGVRRVLPDYGKGEQRLPVYKMPHLEGWAMSQDYAFVPGVGQHEVLVIDRASWELVKRIPVHGQPVFVMARPDGRQVWVNFAHPRNDTVQVIDVDNLELVTTLTPGKAVLHMEFTPRGEHVWVSVRDENRLNLYDTDSFRLLKTLPAESPSGIFFTDRAHRIGL